MIVGVHVSVRCTRVVALHIVADPLETRQATHLAIRSVTSSATTAKRLVPRMTQGRPSPARRCCTGKSCSSRDRRSSLHLHASESITGPSMIFRSATGSCSSLPGPDSDWADARTSGFRANVSPSTMISTALLGDSYSTHFSSLNFPGPFSAARHSCHSTTRGLTTCLTIPRQPPRQKRAQDSPPVPLT